jgi:hypothetical protein
MGLVDGNMGRALFISIVIRSPHQLTMLHLPLKKKKKTMLHLEAAADSPKPLKKKCK